MHHNIRRLAFAVTLLVPVQAGAQEHDHHEHHAAPQAPAKKPGAKWATDAPLRAGMTAVRDALQADLHAVHTGKATGAQYLAAADKIDAAVQRIFQDCKLEPAADAALHEILVPILENTKALRGKGDRHKAFVAIVRAVNQYGERFDHPGWSNVGSK